MKKLILVRHGKSSWEENLPDHERPLKKRAYKDAELVLKALEHLDLKGLQLWSSSAVRALTTAKLFRDQLDISSENFEVKKELYTFDGTRLLNIIKSCDDSVDSLMVFGHNPAMTRVVNHLGDQEFKNVPTTGLTLIELTVNSWQELKKGKTILYLFPKNLR